MKKLGFLLLFTLLAALNTNAAPAAKTDSVSSKSDSSYQAMNANQREAALVQKLDADQLFELEKIRSGARDEDSQKLSSPGIVMISLMPFFTAILIVFLVMRYKRQKEQRFMALCEKALEAGRDLPDNFFKKPQEETQSHLLKGMIWVGVGVGVTYGALELMGDHSPWGFGLIPAFIGVAYIISYFIEKKNKANDVKNE